MTTVAIRLPVGFAGADADAWTRPRTFPRPDLLERALDVLPGVGPVVRKKLERLGLHSLADLLAHRPFRYEEPVPERRIAELGRDEEVAIAGEVLSVSKRRRGRLQMLTARVTDGSATVSATWFNQPWLERQLLPGTPVRLRGRQGRYGFDVRSFDIGDGGATADFAPVYPASEEITAKKLRELVGAALPPALVDPLPARVREGERLPLRGDALWALHRPRSLPEAERGRRRLAFDELLVLQLGIARRRREREAEIAPALPAPGDVVARYRDVLPFRLTEHQERAIAEIDADLQRTVPMQRLLQGDVGSGKTVVALYALLRAVEADRQGALMAPTETLAEQHVLHMTATPIPRTLALTVYGDLSVSEIARPPATRKPIVTGWVTAERSSESYKRLRRHLDAGRQAYVVCPLIEESEASVARAAEAEAERLRRGELKGYRVGLMHGRLRPAEQSYCLLISRPREELTDAAGERLEALVATTDGFELAEKDLEIRGEGQLLGTRQSGLSDLKFTRLRADRALLEQAREEARNLVDYVGPFDGE